MKNTFKAVLAAVIVVPLAAVAQQAKTDSARVLADLHRTNQMEIHMGSMASSKASAADVKEYASRLVAQHRDADQEVAQIAKKENIALDPKPVDDTAPDMMRLRKLENHDFDREFLKTMIDGHNKAIAMVKAAETTTKDDKLRTLLNKLLPSLEEHRKAATKLLNQSAER